MKVKFQFVAPILICSAICALLGQDLLFTSGNQTDFGLGLAVVTLLAGIGTAFLAKKKIINLKIPLWAVIVPFLVVTYGYAVPDSVGLDTLNTFTFMLCLGMIAVLQASDKETPFGSITFLAPIRSLTFPFIGIVAPWIVDYRDVKANSKFPFKAVAIGLVSALPVLLVFGSMLASADPVFGKFFEYQGPNLGESALMRVGLFGTVFSTTLGFWSTLCTPYRQSLTESQVSKPEKRLLFYFRGCVFEVEGPPPPPTSFMPQAYNKAHAVAFCTFLGSIISLFVLFSLVQMRYLFGGNDVVLQTANLSYGDYARRGFFEIFGVTCATLPILLIGQSAFESLPKKQTVARVSMVLATTLLPLLASAAYRLVLYINAYGLSSLRFYTGAGILWLTLAIGSYLFLAPRWQLSKVVFSGYASLVGITMLCNLVRPDAVIASVSISQMSEKNLDRDMLQWLGADAAPTLAGMKDTTMIRGWRANHPRLSDWKVNSVSSLLQPK